MATVKDAPITLEGDELYQEAMANLTKLQSERDELEQKINRFGNRPKPVRRDQAAEDLVVGGAAIAVAVDEEWEDPEPMCDRRRIVYRAIELQERAIGEIQSRVSREICKQEYPKYRQIVRNVAAAALALANAVEEERKFREAIIDTGAKLVPPIVPTVIYPGVASLRDGESSHISRFLSECKRDGYVGTNEKQRDLPKVEPVKIDEPAAEADDWTPTA